MKEPDPAVKASAMAKYARQLRGWRQRMGWSQTELADKLGYSVSLISQVEGESKAASAAFAARCDEIFDTPGTFTDLQELLAREAWPSYFAPVIDLEIKATQIHEWDSRAVPGLLQTEDYARSVISAGQLRMNPDQVERKVAARIERQAIFHRESGRPLYWAVLHEGLLRHVIGSPAIMGDQLDRLIELAGLPDFVIQVLPFTAHDHPGVDGPIMIFNFDGTPSAAYTECNGGGMIIEQPDQVSQLVTNMSLIRVAALSPRESRDYLRMIRDEIA